MKRECAVLLVCVLLLSLLAGCGAGPGAELATSETAQAAGSDGEAQPAAAATSAAPAAASVAEALAAKDGDHEDAGDAVWDSSAAVLITLHGSSIAVDGEGAGVDGSRVTISSAGTYLIGGSLADGQIVVDAPDEALVRLVLNGVEVRSSTSAPLYVAAAEKVVIVLADDTENFLSDAAAYVFQSAEEDEPNAALFSTADLTLVGNGSLTVEGNYNDGIASKDGLIIAGGTITVAAADDGIRGKDYVVIRDGTLNVTAQGDGLKSDNEQDDGRGYVAVEGGTITIAAGGDALAAQTDVLIAAGDLYLTSGGGSAGRVAEGLSAKGIKGVVSVIVEDGNLVLDSADDAIHSNGSLVINGGTFAISSGDDALHADAALQVNGGEIDIAGSYEGLESAVITINDGRIDIVASDDGLNVAGGIDGSGARPGPGRAGGMRPGATQGQAFVPGQDAFAASSAYRLQINGGTVTVDAAGDGIDVNGIIAMTGGVVLVSGPTVEMNGALDYDAGFQVTGGLLVAAGSSGMAQAPDGSSSQYSLLLNLNGVQQAGTLFHIQSSEGEEIVTFSPGNDYESIAFSSGEIAEGVTYHVYLGGSSTGTVNGGLYQDGIYTPGTEAGSFTVSSVVTLLGGRGRNR